MLILGIIANLVAFIAFIAFADSIIKWITYLLGFEDIGTEFIFSIVFMPVAWLIGIPWEDCRAVGNVIGIKTIINEFVAFEVLGRYIKNGEISVELKFFFNNVR
jgi:pyrimidine nucleoside transport protein